MRISRLLKIVALVLVLAGATTGLRAPLRLLRHYVVARFNEPTNLLPLEGNPRIRFQESARACAGRVAALLSSALVRVEKEQGRPFARIPTIGVYASLQDYARASGLEEPTISGVSRSGYVLLSPTLCGDETDRLEGVLVHELSHSHIFGWRTSLFASRPPSWFTEGLATLVSGGAGAEGAKQSMAARAMAKGYAIVVEDRGIWRDFSSIRFQIEPPPELFEGDAWSGRQSLAYREAAMFVDWLRRGDPQAFSRLVGRIENNEPFKRSFFEIYDADSSQLWREFLSGFSG